MASLTAESKFNPAFQSSVITNDGITSACNSTSDEGSKGSILSEQHSARINRRQNRIYSGANQVLTTESRTKTVAVRQYGSIFRPTFVNPNEEPLVDPTQSEPDEFFNDFVKFAEDPRSKRVTFWHYPYIREFPQRTALRTVGSFMPQSKVRECLNVTDGSNVDDIVDHTCHGYYCRRHMKAFFNYDEEFEYMRNGTDVSPRRLEPPKLKLPMDMPSTEGDKERPSVPLGWRTFAVLGLYPTATEVADPSILWSGYRLEDGDPVGRLASGLYTGNFGLLQFTAKDAVKPDNTLLRSKHPIEQGEKFRGKRGDMSYLGPQDPLQHETINEKLLHYRFCEDGVWPKKHFECVISSMTVIQALWARLSTTMLRSTAKIHRMYKLRVRKNFKQEIFSSVRKHSFIGNPEKRKEEPVETSVGTMYIMSAPSLHHAVNFVCSDPLARNNFYKQLLLFEADDAIKDMAFDIREPNQDNPRQYVVLGSYSRNAKPDILQDKMTRFLVRSNCVNTHLSLHAPKKDCMTDFRMPVQQFLPITGEQGAKFLGTIPTLKDACSQREYGPAIGDLTIINQFDSDDAFDWARRSPYTRAGCYESLFVAKAHEIGFYGRNCCYIAPLPMEKALTPVKQEYAIIERDPVDVLRQRMADGHSHVIALPKIIARSSDLYKCLSHNEKSPLESNDSVLKEDGSTGANSAKSIEGSKAGISNWWSKRLLITFKRTVSNTFAAHNVSSRYCTLKKRKVDRQAYLGKVPYSHDNGLSVDILPDLQLGRRRINMKHKVKRGNIDPHWSRLDGELLYVDTDHGKATTYGDVQMIPNILISPEGIKRLMSENAPIELDRPFFADLLKDYVYISLPPGDFFEFLPADNNTRLNKMAPGNEHMTATTAEDMNKLPENKPVAFAGFWMKKRDCHLLYKSHEERCMLMGQAPSGNNRRSMLDKETLNRAMVRNEIQLDYIRKGAAHTWPDLSNAYSQRSGKLITHLSPEEQLKTVWTVDPMNKPNTRYRLGDALPPSRFYQKNLKYSPEDPRSKMVQHPEELYKITLEFLQKVDRGEARVEDDPVKALVESDHIMPTEHKDTVSTWEEPDIDILKLNEKVVEEESAT